VTKQEEYFIVQLRVPKKDALEISTDMRNIALVLMDQSMDRSGAMFLIAELSLKIHNKAGKDIVSGLEGMLENEEG
jgi:hypothetical protein